VPVLTALGIAAETVANAAMAAGLPRLGEGVKRGEGIAGPLRATGAFPPMALHMVSVGEETGRLESMLLKVAEVYDERVKISVKRFLGLLEPILILSLGLLVGFIVLSMLLAVISLGDIPI
jgi:general secretion pathway protein F